MLKRYLSRLFYRFLFYSRTRNYNRPVSCFVRSAGPTYYAIVCGLERKFDWRWSASRRVMTTALRQIQDRLDHEHALLPRRACLTWFTGYTLRKSLLLVQINQLIRIRYFTLRILLFQLSSSYPRHCRENKVDNRLFMPELCTNEVHNKCSRLAAKKHDWYGLRPQIWKTF